MNHPAATAKLIAIALLILVSAVLLWPYALMGLLLAIVKRGRSIRWYFAVLALCLVITWRLTIGHWPVSIGERGDTRWLIELSSGIVSWCLSSIFVAMFYRIPTNLMSGFRDASSRK